MRLGQRNASLSYRDGPTRAARRTTTGQTADLPRRLLGHQTGAVPGFTKKYGVTILVWFEVHESRESAYMRERQIKAWRRAWKLRLIAE
ncbi:MAG: GIY-YIG nuclease family protein [Bauldia sp.]